MTEITKTNKTWVTAYTFTNFKDADAKRNELKEKHEAVKVKRGVKGGEVFRVKIWDIPAPQNKKSKRKKQNNVNKKVRNR